MCDYLSTEQLAEQLYQTMTRQFRSELSVWTDFGLFLMKRGKVDTARSVLQRCLKALTIKQQRTLAYMLHSVQYMCTPSQMWRPYPSLLSGSLSLGIREEVAPCLKVSSPAIPEGPTYGVYIVMC